MTMVVKVKVISQSCSVMEHRESGRHLLSKKNCLWGKEGRGLVLTSRDISSLVVDRLCDQARGQKNTVVTCFYFYFAARKEQSATNMLGSLLK